MSYAQKEGAGGMQKVEVSKVESGIKQSNNDEPDIQLSPNIGQEEVINYKAGGYQQIPFETERVEITGIQAYKKGLLPSAYDSRHLLPEVRNQTPFNTCWSFAAMAAAESSLISKRALIDGAVADGTIDLSEYQLARLQYFNVDDPLNNTTEDKTVGMCYGVDITDEENVTSGGSYLNIGGNAMFSTWIMAGWKAGADEKTVPYDSIISTNGVFGNSIAYENKVHMKNAYWLPTEEVQVIKKMIMEYGALASSYIHNDNAYNTQTNAYFSGMTKQEASASYNSYGHGIALVGWDDNYNRENFNKDCRPKRNGAWLMRNSWGTASGESGYFWMSYEEKTLDSVAMAFEFQDAEKYDYNYQYDGSSGVQYISNSGAASVANVFQVKGSGNQILQAVGIGLQSTNVDYEIQIYKDPQPGKPASGTPMLLEVQKGKTTYSGYHTIELQQPVFLEYGHTFSVVFSFDKKTKIFVDYSYENGGWIRFVSHTQSGQSFLFGESWCYDLSEKYNACARIKAYTNEAVNYGSEIFKAEPGIDGSIQMYNKSVLIYTGGIDAPAKMEISENTFICNGQVKRPEVMGVYDSQGRKIPQSNYDIAYSDVESKIPGNYQVKIIFKGEYYTGSMSQSYHIRMMPMEKIKLVECRATSVELSWKCNPDAQGYYIYVSDKKNGDYKKIATIKKNSKGGTCKNLKPGKTYYFKVKSYIKTENGTCVSEFSNIVTATTKPAKVKFQQAQAGKKYVKLKWKKAAGASGYEVYVYNKSKKKYVKKTTINKAATTSKKLTSLKRRTTYKYKMRAFKKVGETYVYGDFSNIKTVKTK